ncbi:MAG: hypothetical protein HPY53_05485 [Brevinematales bacterium]|nr:hypothetical protein [Brevinematales bacterium]
MEFRIEAETRRPCLSGIKKVQIKKSTILLCLLGLMSLFPVSCANECKPLAGSPALPPMDISNKQELTALIDGDAESKYGISFVHDYPLEITYQGKTIKFTADGFDMANKIAYEFIGLKDYYSNTIKDDVLTIDEIESLQNMKFGEYYIAVLNMPSSVMARSSFRNTIDQFISDGNILYNLKKSK